MFYNQSFLIQSDWWTWLTFGIELAATLAAFFLTGGWYLAAKLVALMVAAANVIKSAIDVGKSCGAKSIDSPSRKIFYLKNSATGKYLDVRYAKCNNGTPLILYQFIICY